VSASHGRTRPIDFSCMHCKMEAETIICGFADAIDCTNFGSVCSTVRQTVRNDKRNDYKSFGIKQVYNVDACVLKGLE
jgi:hypothetical protein